MPSSGFNAIIATEGSARPLDLGSWLPGHRPICHLSSEGTMQVPRELALTAMAGDWGGVQDGKTGGPKFAPV